MLIDPADQRAADTTPVTEDEVSRSIDALVGQAITYRSSRELVEFLRFAGRFRSSAPFNCLLIHAQLPGAAFVQTAGKWQTAHGRRVLPGQQPIVIMQPFGPVMFVFDVSQTEPVGNSGQLPVGVTPFVMPPIQRVEKVLEHTLENAKADGVRVHFAANGSFAAGCIRPTESGGSQEVKTKGRPVVIESRAVRYECEINRSFSATERYATLAHELAHLYCGHIGTHNPHWWTARTRLSTEVCEFEAECAAAIACWRLDDQAKLPPHLAQYLAADAEVPAGISLSRIVVSTEQILKMGRGWLAPRKKRR